ncbi:hypothetical protein [Metallosphaera cuprina]|uniref:Uncharacterized protein n=1 Tax=Metallosphaera cuprina (strain Ar-4) TaxID=1006006 RepID=F4G299_METCR|nr:hypothetical protein [Metallosphaera cuprina]AEB94947.1 conserved hypothetical protein [Metallosphaera cuprina Ar-4]
MAITQNKRLLLELGSMGFSSVVMTEDQFKIICERGEPLCYYALYDSKVVCGSLPNVKFVSSELTCNELDRLSRAQLKLSLEGIARSDEISSINNLYRGIRSYIRGSCCKRGKIPLSDVEVLECCKESLDPEVCDLFFKVKEMRIKREPVSYWTVRRFLKYLERVK